MRPQDFNIGSEAFDDFRFKLDMALKIVARNLKEKKLTEGTVCANIRIVIRENKLESGETVHELELAPDIKIKIGAKGKLDCAEKGGMLIEFDNEGNPYIGTNQIEITDLLKEGA